MAKIEELVERFELEPHPEGGFFKEMYRSEGVIPQVSLGKEYRGDRNWVTSIYFLLTKGNFSAFHRINQDEIWHHYDGSAILVHVIDPEGNYSVTRVGTDYEKGQIPQFVVPGGSWFASEVEENCEFAFVGCTVAPGFDFDDFELPDREKLVRLFPQHREIITRLTR